MTSDVNFSAGYVCGVLCSDGKVVWSEKHSNYAISLETKNDEFARLFMNNLKLHVEKEPRMGTHKRKNGDQTFHMNMITVYGRKDVGRFLSKWGLIHGRRNWSVPAITWNDIDFRRGFLRGFFDGNGSVSVSVNKDEGKRRAIILYSVNEKGLREVHKLLEKEGIKSIMYPVGKCFAVKISGKMRIQTFIEKVNFGLTDKKRRLDKALLPLSVSGYDENI